MKLFPFIQAAIGEYLMLGSISEEGQKKKKNKFSKF
jgi:hypothetical protein